jgi:Rieske Fe-S protein
MMEEKKEAVPCPLSDTVEEKAETSRRQFVKSVVGVMVVVFGITTLASILRYLWPIGTKKGPAEVEIGRAGEVPIGEFKDKWLFKGFPSILIHDEEGFRAFALKCTHLGCTASWREEGWPALGRTEPVLFCPCHDGVFDPKTGEVLAGPPPSPLPEILVEEKAGMIVATDWKDPAYVAELAVYKK